VIVVGRAGGEDWTLIVAPAINAGVIGSGDAIASKHAITQDRLAASYADVAPEGHSANRSLSAIEPVCGPPKWKLKNAELSRQRHDRRLAKAAAVALYAVLEPEGERRVRLMAQP